jgi:hypothetical protein
MALKIISCSKFKKIKRVIVKMMMAVVVVLTMMMMNSKVGKVGMRTRNNNFSFQKML